MNDSIKIRLINSLIDAVSHFYEYKQKKDRDNQQHLKGFCEGLAYSLVEQKILSQKEAQKILQGLGKKREVEQQEPKPKIEEKIEKKKEEKLDLKNLDIPTIFRKKQDKKS